MTFLITLAGFGAHGIISLLILVLVVAILLWLITKLPPVVSPFIRQALQLIIVVVAIVWTLRMLSVL